EVAERGAERVDITLHPSQQAREAQPIQPSRPPEVAGRDAPPRASPGVPLYAKVAFGVGATGLAFGAVTGVAALSHVGSARKLCVGDSCDPAASHDIDAAKSFSHLSTIGFSIGLIGAAVGLVGVLTSRDTAPPPNVSASLTGAGGGVAGRF